MLCPSQCIISGGTWCQFVSSLMMSPSSVTARWKRRGRAWSFMSSLAHHTSPHLQVFTIPETPLQLFYSFVCWWTFVLMNVIASCHFMVIMNKAMASTSYLSSDRNFPWVCLAVVMGSCGRHIFRFNR